MDPLTLITTIAAGIKGILGVLPKSDKKRLRMATPFLEVTEISLEATVQMLVARAASGAPMESGEINALAFNLAQSAGYIDAVGDTLRGFDDDEVKP